MAGEDVPQWRLFCDQDAELFRSYGAELAAIASPAGSERDANGLRSSQVKYYQRDRSKSYDPLYGETTSKDIWRGPYPMPTLVQYDESDGRYDQETTEFGVDRLRTAEAVITVNDWKVYVQEAHDPAFESPAEGDLLCLFDGSETYSVEKVTRSGYILNSNEFVEWKLELRSRDSFEPERLLPPGLRPAPA